MRLKNWLRASVLLSASATVACGAGSDATEMEGREGVQQTGEALVGQHNNLIWQNVSTGEVAAWLVSGNHVTGKATVDRTCGPQNGCTAAWTPIDTSDNTILWWNHFTGTVQWRIANSYGVSSDLPLSWTCGSGCASTWTPVGETSWRPPSNGPLGVTARGLLWYERSSGTLGVWQLDGSNGVTGKANLSWTCAGSCANDWQPVLTADFNGDGNSDVLWWNKSTGILASWLLADDGATVAGTQNVAWPCGTSNGCTSRYSIVAAGDVNGDGYTDLTWHDGTTGQISSWLLDGRGGVTGTLTLDWTCGTGCWGTWKPLGYITIPNPPSPPPK